LARLLIRQPRLVILAFVVDRTAGTGLGPQSFRSLGHPTGHLGNLANVVVPGGARSRLAGRPDQAGPPSWPDRAAPSAGTAFPSMPAQVTKVHVPLTPDRQPSLDGREPA